MARAGANVLRACVGSEVCLSQHRQGLQLWTRHTEADGEG